MKTLESKRLILRNFAEDDFHDLHEYLSDPDVLAFEPYDVMTPDETRDNLQWRLANDEMIAVELKESCKLIGNIYLGKREYDSLELGFVFNKNYWHQGFAKEACECLIMEAFRRSVHRIYAQCDPENHSSQKLLERLGFQREAHLRQNVYFRKDEQDKPIWKDSYIYGLLNPYE